jgi:hypothetical protein
VSTPFRQLLAYRFGSDSRFEGQLVGALERIESGGAMRVLDVLFIARAPESGELVALSLSAGAAGGTIGRLLDFRLDPAERTAETRRALEGAAGETVEALGAMLEQGSAIAAVIVEHAWADALGEAVARVGGTEVANELVQASRVSEVTQRLRAAAEPNA